MSMGVDKTGRAIDIDRPLMSMVVSCYNQKQYIAEVLAACFSQTYRPLEIIVVDDASKDGSDRICQQLIREFVASAADDKCKIVFVRNERNLGILRTFEKAFLMAHGDLIVVNGGDDLSHSNRVAVIAEKWIEKKVRPTVVFHGVELINTNGQKLGYDYWKPSIRNPLGAAMAYTRDVVARFPRVVEYDGYEDSVFARRAYALGEPMWIDDKLIDYRLGSGQSTKGGHASKRQRIAKAMVSGAKQGLLDIDAIRGGGGIPECRYFELRDLLEEVCESYGIELGYDPIRKFKCYLLACRRSKVRWWSLRNFLVRYIVFGYPRFAMKPSLMYHDFKGYISRIMKKWGRGTYA